MHCHDCGLKIEIPPGARKIVLAGNPNVGKSVFFNALTGMYVDVSNYPGTTLEISHGRYEKDMVIDTPGVYGISSFNDEERIARDIILSADIVVNIVDAVHMERDLFLTQQIIDTGVPVVVALNMVDESSRAGLDIDYDLLSDLLGVPVIPTIAIQKKGIDILKEMIDKARSGNIDHDLQQQLKKMQDRVASQGEALLVLEGDPVVAERHGLVPGSDREEIYMKRRHRVNDIVGHVVRETNKGFKMGEFLGRMLLQPVTGIPFLVLVLWGMYEFIGVFIAQTVVGFTEGTIMQGQYEIFVRSLINPIFPQEGVIGTILIGEFGVLTMTVTYILGLLLPLVIGFYFALGIFEDSGYMPRLATLADRVMNGIGLNGRAIIPILLGLGCVTMATITTRLLGNDRERKIAVFLLALAIPCSAQLAAIMGIFGKMIEQGNSPAFVWTYVLVVFSVLVVVGTLMNRFLPGEATPLLIDLPPLRLPRLENVLKKTVTKSYHFIKEATPLFAIGALIVGGMQVTGFLEMLQEALKPLTTIWLRLPKETATVFIMGFVRRDFGAAGLSTMQITAMQQLIGLITITLFVPCIASTLIIFKERGRREALKVWPVILAIAFFVGGLVAQLDKIGGLSAIIGFFTAVLVVTIVVAKLPKKHLIPWGGNIERKL